MCVCVCCCCCVCVCVCVCVCGLPHLRLYVYVCISTRDVGLNVQSGTVTNAPCELNSLNPAAGLQPLIE